MSDPVIRQTSVVDYMAANRPVDGFRPVPIKVSTRQTAADLDQVRKTIAADSQVAAAANAALKSAPTPRIDDVAAMKPEEAEARLSQLTLLRTVGGFDRIGANAVNGDQKTTSVDTYMDWLKARAEQKTSKTTSVTPPPLFDVTA